MKTVTFIARNRPLYTGKALSAIAKSLLTNGEGSYDKLIVSIDRLPDGSVNPGVEQVCEEMCKVIVENGIADCEMYVNSRQMGVGGNHFIAMQRAFEEHGSDFNVCIEDDAVVTLDAFWTADWFLRIFGWPTSEYLFYSMCNHNEFGRGSNPGNIPDGEDIMVEAPYITSPFAWAFTRHQWPFIKATWNRKDVDPMGWDWSLSFAMWLTGKMALHPAVSRCQNIGREGGTHETPETFDQTQLDLKYSSGTQLYEEYEIFSVTNHPKIPLLNQWMSPEKERIFAR